MIRHLNASHFISRLDADPLRLALASTNVALTLQKHKLAE